MAKKQSCPHCGQTINARKESLTIGIVRTLYKFAVAVQSKRINKIHPRSEVKMTKSEYNNFQKLRYHALVAKYKENGVHKSGYWLLTKKGNQFLNGIAQTAKFVHVLNNKVIDKSGPMIDIYDIAENAENTPYFPEISTIQYAE
jgi:hypothetical protein